MRGDSYHNRGIIDQAKGQLDRCAELLVCS